MHRVFIAVACASLTVLLGTPCRAQGLPTKQEAAEMNRRVREDMRLQVPGTLPFHLSAAFHIEIAGKSFDGTYEILWLNADQFREEFRMGKVGETDLVLGDKKYVLRTTPALAIQLWDVRSLLALPFPLVKDDDPKVMHVHAEGDSRQFYVDVDQGSNVPAWKMKYWYGLSNRQIVSIHGEQPQPRFGSIPPPDFSLELSDFVSLGHKRIPQRWHRNALGQSVDVHIEKLEEVSAFASSVFLAPPHAAVYDTCRPDNAKWSGPWPHFPPVLLMHPKAFPAYYLLLGPDGRVKRFDALIASGGTVDRDMDKWFHDTPLPAMLCDGKPIEYETVVVPLTTVSLGMDH
jgi:hypothetical protein